MTSGQRSLRSIRNSENLYPLSESPYVHMFPGCEDLGNVGIVKTLEGVVVIDTDVRTVDQRFAALQVSSRYLHLGK